MRAFWKRVECELAEGRGVFVCLVASNLKGSPGTPAARMLVSESGEQYGTIGGGIMEKNNVAEARTILSSKRKHSAELKFLKHHSSQAGQESGLFCGGEQTNLELILRGDEDLGLARELLDLLDEEPSLLRFGLEGCLCSVCLYCLSS